MTSNSLVVEALSVTLGRGEARHEVVRGVSLCVEPGKAVALVGESGSGKSVTARSLVGLAGSTAAVKASRLTYAGRELLSYSQAQWRAMRGKDIGFVLQDALVSLDPLRTVGQELREALSAHDGGSRKDHDARVLELLARVGIPDPALRARQRSDQLSGGLRQRALIATALALDPPILIADEPTTALDTTVQAQILDLLLAIKQRGTGLLIISHDLAVVSRLADEILVLHQGEVVERGTTDEVLSRPRHTYTQTLLAAVPGRRPGRPAQTERDGASGTVVQARPTVVLEAAALTKTFEGPRQSSRLAVDAVSFALEAGRTVGIIGESGSGKTTTARLALALLQPDAGAVTFDGAPWVAAADGPSERDRRPRRHQFGVVYQDPLSSFDPRWTVGQILGDALQAGGTPAEQRGREIASLLEKVRLTPDYAARRPLELSGGQRQRVAIARAIATRPKVIVCDEPVSALDVSVQAQVLDLLLELQAEFGLAYLFISHDLGVIRHMSDIVLVMQNGRVVEQGATEAIFSAPRHTFTRQLIAASPSLDLEPANRSAA